MLQLREEAISDFESILQLQENYLPALKGLAEAHYEYARELYGSGFFGRAHANLEKAQKVLTTCLLQEEGRHLQCFYKLLGDVNTFYYFLPFLGSGPSTPFSLEELLTKKLKYLERGTKAYLKGSQLHPDIAELYYDQGRSLYLQLQVIRYLEGDNSERVTTLRKDCVQAFKKAIRLDKTNPTFWEGMSAVQTNPSSQQKGFTKAIELNPKVQTTSFNSQFFIFP
jgi:superkiller protein 3